MLTQRSVKQGKHSFTFHREVTTKWKIIGFGGKRENRGLETVAKSERFPVKTEGSESLEQFEDFFKE